MQKVINVISIVSFLTVLTTVGGLGYGWFNRDKIIDSAMSQIKSELPKLVKESMPTVPKMTGPAMNVTR